MNRYTDYYRMNWINTEGQFFTEHHPLRWMHNPMQPERVNEKEAREFHRCMRLACCAEFIRKYAFSSTSDYPFNCYFPWRFLDAPANFSNMMRFRMPHSLPRSIHPSRIHGLSISPPLCFLPFWNRYSKLRVKNGETNIRTIHRGGGGHWFSNYSSWRQI